MMDGLNRLANHLPHYRAAGNVRADIRVRLLLYGAWNDYLFASIFLSSASNFTLPVGLNALFSTPDYIWGRMMAASLVTGIAGGDYVRAFGTFY
ncbi:binding-protein-dependent transport system inner membrane protein [Escherichia coli]|uniref:Binding-protein-dependent transport system inner membrane protein n=1 Tax=Escherichia coli TaxID=562 RepID=A0A377D432_ECOLX|nr:binding-protein-dependent transport system inner membrane protein [Escherichia coli]